MLTGQCNCGAVTYAALGDPFGIFVCHCSICRRATGANGIAVVLVPKDQFRWLCGEDQISSWSKPDGDWHTWFCKVCGSPVPGHNDAERMFIPAGTLMGGGEALRVEHHIWVGSRAAWDEIGDGGRQHVEAFVPPS